MHFPPRCQWRSPDCATTSYPTSSAFQQPQMSDPTNPTSKTPHRSKKPKKPKKPTRSSYFLLPPPGPKKSPYFKNPSRRSRGAKNHGPVENQLAADESKFLSQIANNWDDGWMTERESCHGGELDACRGTRKDRERRSSRSKVRSRHKLDGNNTSVDDARESGAVRSPSLRIDEAEAGQLSTVQKARADWEEKGGKQTDTPAMDISSYEARQLKKRKQVSTFEVVITSSLKLSPPDPTLDIPVEPPEGGELEHRKRSGNRKKRARTTNESPTAEGVCRPRLSKTITGDVDTRQKAESLKHRNSPNTITDHQVVTRRKGPPNPSKNSWPAGNSLLIDDTPSTKPRRKRKPATSPKRTLLQKVMIQELGLPVSAAVELRPEKIDQALEPTTEPCAKLPRKITRYRTKKTGTVSSYFASSATQGIGKPREISTKQRVPAGTSVIPWPPLAAEAFGLVQEELQGDSFHVIIATIFLNKTRAATAIPLFRQFLIDYPTPLALSKGDLQTITAFLQPLGLHRTRANRLIKLGQTWLTHPPTPGSGVPKYNYPPRDTKPFHTPLVRPTEQNCEWEIAHLPGVGAYALDSWRIFCLDGFRGEETLYGPEWRRVVPKDKELRAYLRWMWAKEGVRWKEAGDVEVEIQEAHIGGESGDCVSE